MLGKVPAASNCATCCSGWVSQSASAAAASLCFDVSGPQERSAPVGGATGEDVGEVPAGGGVAAAGLDVALDDAEHPARADEGGEGAVDEGLAAFQSHGRLRGGEAVVDAPAEQVEAPLRSALSSTFSSPSEV